jgi:mannose-1-phosphate guanylyltransferase
MKAVILVGGEGTRLRPLTCNTPKAMVPVLNRPFLEHVVNYLKGHGIVDIILATGQQFGQIQDYFGDGGEFGVRLTCSVEDFPRGTAGAVKKAEKFLDGPFVVFNGDIFTRLDLTAMLSFHREKKPVATIALTPVEDPTIYGVVETDEQGRVRCFTEKPKRDEVTTNMINAGLYIVEPCLLDHITPDTFFSFEHDVFPLLLEKGQAIYGFPTEAYWIDIGTPEKYRRLNCDLLLRDIKGVRFDGESSVHPSARISAPAVVGAGCSIGKDSVVKGPVVIGPGCRIGEGATVEGAVLWQDCEIGSGAKLRNCVIASGCCIEPRSEIGDNCVLGDNVTVAPETRLPEGIMVWPAKYR